MGKVKASFQELEFICLNPLEHPRCQRAAPFYLCGVFQPFLAEPPARHVSALHSPRFFSHQSPTVVFWT